MNIRPRKYTWIERKERDFSRPNEGARSFTKRGEVGVFKREARSRDWPPPTATPTTAVAAAQTCHEPYTLKFQQFHRGLRPIKQSSAKPNHYSTRSRFRGELHPKPWSFAVKPWDGHILKGGIFFNLCNFCPQSQALSPRGRRVDVHKREPLYAEHELMIKSTRCGLSRAWSVEGSPNKFSLTKFCRFSSYLATVQQNSVHSQSQSLSNIGGVPCDNSVVVQAWCRDVAVALSWLICCPRRAATQPSSTCWFLHHYWARPQIEPDKWVFVLFCRWARAAWASGDVQISVKKNSHTIFGRHPRNVIIGHAMSSRRKSSHALLSESVSHPSSPPTIPPWSMHIMLAAVHCQGASCDPGPIVLGPNLERISLN